MLIGAALLFWGWQTDLLPVAAILAVLMEVSRWVRARWDFSQPDLDRLWNICTLLFLGAAVYAFSSGEGSLIQSNPRARAEVLARGVRAVFLFFQWMPFYFIPIIAAQAWGERETIPLSTFSWWLRRKRRSVGVSGRGSVGVSGRGSVGASERQSVSGSEADSDRRPPGSPGSLPAEARVNISYPYFAICILGASAARARSIWFLAGMFLLLGWAFWERRSRSWSLGAWVASLLLAAALGLVTQKGLLYLESALQNLDNALVARFNRGASLDVTQTRTMLGAVGELKLSGRIVLHVRSGNNPPPGLLRESSYNMFKSPVWGSSRRDFAPVIAENDERTWLLMTNRTANRSVTIASLLSGGKGVLPLPQGAAELQHLSAYALEKNRLGAVKAEGPGFLEFDTKYSPELSFDAQPVTDDLVIPVAEKLAIARIGDELKLREKSPSEVLKSVAAFFYQHFEYSTWLGDEGDHGLYRSPITQFLLETRKGHCEYFATATTLLLRYAQVPARYTVGYAVAEHRGNDYVVRARDAHAWCLAWVDGAWREVDNTPSSWREAEASHVSFWQPLSDAWSRFWFAFCKWRWSQSQSRRYLPLLLIVPLLAIVGRLLTTRGWRRAKKKPVTAHLHLHKQGLDSEFYLVEERLAQLGMGRNTGETFVAWLRRISRSGAVNVAELSGLLELHYRLRFDPRGLPAQERGLLSKRAQEWLEGFER